MTTIIIKDLEIDAGHRLLRHEGKCRHVHGHRYRFSITAFAPSLDDVGRIIDFSVIKSVVGGWLDKNWDHGFIAQAGDPLIAVLDDLRSKFYVIGVPPTAENLAQYLLEQCRGELAQFLNGVEIVNVVCWETPTSRAEVTP